MSDPAEPFSPTASSLSSSDLDTESTGSFFHDTSTSLGTLMGVTLQAITFRASSQHRQPEPPISAANGRRRTRRQESNSSRKRRRWWMLCREESDSRRASLEEYLAAERSVAAAAEIEEGVVRVVPRNGRELFADGRVLPPVEDDDDTVAAAAGIWRFTAVVCLGGICRCCKCNCSSTTRV